MASTAFAEWAPSRTSRIGGASPRSESMTRKPSLCAPNACSGRINGSRIGTRTRRDCWEASRRILFHRSERFFAAASRAFSLRPVANGTIVLTPSSVAFSSAHSKASNFTIDKSKLHAVSCDFFNAAEPDLLAVAQLVELAWLSAQDAAQVVRGLTFNNR